MQWSNFLLHVESDCMEAINMVKSEKTDRSRYAFLAREIKLQLLEREACITHVRRAQNSISHFMDSYARSFS